MTPSARVQAAIELLDAIIAAARDNGPPADALASAYFRERRYIGSKDRRAVRDLAYRAIRRFGDRPEGGRAAMLGLAAEDSGLEELFDGSQYGPAAIGGDEQAAGGGMVPRWLDPQLPGWLGEAERAALLDRAPLDIRFDPARTDRAVLSAAFPEIQFAEHLPHAARLPLGTPVEAHPLYRDGAIEVQDWGSQTICAACPVDDASLVVDLCAGAGGKTLALAARMRGRGRIIACDTSRARLAALEPRRARAGFDNIETRLLDPNREAGALADLAGQADLVLVDAPCSGTGTWRRNPETRWRLTPARLDRLIAEQARILDFAAPLVRPGGSLVYAVCSLLPAEGIAQFVRFLSDHSDMHMVPRNPVMGRLITAQGLAAADSPSDDRPAATVLTPCHDGTDGFCFGEVQRG